MVDLITGKAGKPHIDGNSLGVLNAGIIGPDDYALDYGDKFAITLDDSNHATIATGCAMLNGRQALISTPEQVTITSGSQGMKRNDLICLRYQRVVSTGIESCTLVVVRGTATTGTPADPTVNTGSILDLVAVHDMPLYRIPLDGITVGTPVPLFNILKPMKDVWDSLTRLPTQMRAGMYIGGTNANGVAVVEFDSPTGKPPDAMIVTVGPWTEDVSRLLSAAVWDVSANFSQIRLRNNNGEWVANHPIRFSWLAIWSRP